MRSAGGFENGMTARRVTPTEAKDLVDREGWVVVDVRSAPEFSAAHPRGAYNVPFLHKQSYGMVANPDFARVIGAAFPDKSAKLITSCAMGGRSMRAAAELTRLGYTNVIDLRGGFEGEKDDGGAVLVQGWRDSGLPVEAGDPPGRAYVELYAAVSIPPPPAPKVESGGHSHAGHGHGHSHAASAGPAVAGIKLNRFASATRKIHCSKLGAELPALKRKPMGGPLGERIFAEISADAWDQWVEHSKLLINEYRMNPSDPKAQELLIKQCEEFLFGAKAEVPKEFVAPKS